MASGKNNDKNTKTTRRSSASIISRLFRGQIISSDFFARHWLRC